MERETHGRAAAARAAIEVVAALLAASALIAALEAGFRIENASSVYLLSVAAIAIRWGTVAALVTAAGAFLAYNLLFVEPRITLTVARPEEVVTLLLLLFVGSVIGRLAGRQRDRERIAQRREREARALFGITRELATAQRLPDAMRSVVDRLVIETAMDRVWIGLGPTILQERVAADSRPGEPVPPAGTHAVLRRDRGEATVAWTRIHPGASAETRQEHGVSLYRVELRGAEEPIGSLWGRRAPRSGDPVLEETRLLAAGADQLGQAISRDRLARRAADLEITRRSEELRSALLDSVSHDLRTPLASIRAAAGSLADPAITHDAGEVRATARSIDDEAERMNRLVGSLLDMSRIQGGALVADLDVIPLGELIAPALQRMRPSLADHPLTVEIPDDLPNVRVDATFLTQALTNVLENAVRHTPDGAPIRVRAERSTGGHVVRLAVEDGGPGVPEEVLPHLFERFYRVDRAGSGARRGFGLGLTVVEGLVEAMGGTVSAGRSALGGLAITLELRVDEDS